MKKMIFFVSLVLALFVMSCTKPAEPVACTADAKICVDGSFVGRDPDNGCEFFPCPSLPDEPGDGLGLVTPYVQYISENVTQCAATDWICLAGSSQFFDGTGCGCKADEPKKYVSQDPQECTLIKFMCEENRVPFFDETGCGCEYSFPADSVPMPPAPGKLQAIDCPAERPQACTKEYMPACGWFKDDIQCVKYPCAVTYGNRCMACADDKVAYYTGGECPTGDDGKLV